MSVPDLTLQTNKGVSNAALAPIVVRQSEKGIVLNANLIQANGDAYDLDGMNVQFSENKAGEKVVIDSNVTISDAKAGKISYTLRKETYQESGTAWFSIFKDDTFVDSSENFSITVEKDIDIHPENDNYITDFESYKKYFDGLDKQYTDQVNKRTAEFNTYVQQIQDKLNSITTAWQAQTSKIQQDANAQIEAAKQADDNQRQADSKKAADQLASDTNAAKDQRDNEASTFNSTLQDQIKQIESARDAAIQQANDDFSKQRDQLASDFADWQKTEHDSYTKTLADIQTHIDQLQNTDLPGMDAKVKDLQAKIAQAEQDAQDATAKFNSIDITKYELKSDLANDYYNKAQADSLLAQAGKLKSVSVNGGSKVQPDSSGNADLTIPKQDMSDYLTKEEAGNTYYKKEDESALETGFNAALDNKADKTDVQQNTNDITQAKKDIKNNSSRLDTMEHNLADMKAKTDALDGSMLVKSCTQAQYDAMTDEQKKSAAWMISDS